MKSAAKIRIIFGALLISGIIGILLSGDIFVLPRAAEVTIGDTSIDGFMLRGGVISMDAEELFEVLGEDVIFEAEGGRITVRHRGSEFKLRAPEISGGKIFVPLREVAERLGCEVRWNSQMMTAYVGMPPAVNSLDGAVVTDEYRYYKYNGTYNGFDIFGNGKEYICTEKVDISEDNRERYAKIINSFAAAVPEAKTYSILVPTSAEFYSSNEKKPDYTAKFRDIYSRLSHKVYGVDVVSALSGHADERIYFNTDHHWTQLGAYYAYREFLKYGFEEIKPPECFKKETVDYYQGSFLEYTKGTDGNKFMQNTYDKLEMYFPSVKYSGESYYDQYLKEHIVPMLAIDTNYRNYDCFMDGDFPVEVYKTDNKNGKRLCIVKDSFGNAFAVWALNNYEEVYVIDYRRFNHYIGDSESYREFKISDFYRTAPFDDLIILNYPVTVSSDAELEALQKMCS